MILKQSSHFEDPQNVIELWITVISTAEFLFLSIKVANMPKLHEHSMKQFGSVIWEFIWKIRVSSYSFTKDSFGCTVTRKIYTDLCDKKALKFYLLQ